LNVPAGKTASAGVHRRSRRAGDCSVATANAKHFRPLGGGAQHRFDLVMCPERDDLGVGELSAHLIDDPGTGTTAGGRIDHQYQALTMPTGGRIDV
jgi:hypothetical protein